MPTVASVAEPRPEGLAGPASDGTGSRPAGKRRHNWRPLGELLVRDGLITPAQLQDALRVQAETTTYAPLGQILVDQKVLTPEQLTAALAKHHKKNRLGDIMVETNTITEEQLELALECQQATGRRLGDVLVRLNFATERQVKEALAKQLDVAFVELDDVAVDRRLTNLIRRGYAEYRRVVPIAMAGDQITLVMDDPTDTEAVQELELATGCKVEVVISTTEAFERAFARAYDEESRSADPGEETQEIDEGLMRWGAPDSQAWADLRAECQALREERDASVRALQELEARRAELTRHLAEREAAHAALRREHAAALEALGGRRGSADAADRAPQDVAESLEAVLRRLKA